MKSLAWLALLGCTGAMAHPDDALSFGGLWWDPARPAQGLFVEELDYPIGTPTDTAQRVAVTWFTWAPQADANPGPRWFTGLGRYEGRVVVVDLVEVRGGRFGVLLDPAQVTRVPWGRVEMAFDGDEAAIKYAGPAAYGSGEFVLRRLTKAGLGLGSGIAFSPPPAGDFTRAGTYYDPLRPAGGWLLNQFAVDGSDAATSMLAWFTWDANGRPIWLHGIDSDDRDGLAFRMQWAMSGGRFEPGYALSQVNLREWGDVTLQSTPCSFERSVTRVDWRADTHGFGDGQVPVARLTRQVELHARPYCP